MRLSSVFREAAESLEMLLPVLKVRFRELEPTPYNGWVQVARSKEFKKSNIKPIVVNDSRFGLRRLFLNAQERPRIGLYAKPGRGQRGESAN